MSRTFLRSFHFTLEATVLNSYYVGTEWRAVRPESRRRWKETRVKGVRNERPGARGIRYKVSFERKLDGGWDQTSTSRRFLRPPPYTPRLVRTLASAFSFLFRRECRVRMDSLLLDPPGGHLKIWSDAAVFATSWKFLLTVLSRGRVCNDNIVGIAVPLYSVQNNGWRNSGPSRSLEIHSLTYNSESCPRYKLQVSQKGLHALYEFIIF